MDKSYVTLATKYCPMCGEVLRAGFYMVLMQTIIAKMRELGVEEDAIAMGIKEVLHGD